MVRTGIQQVRKTEIIFVKNVMEKKDVCIEKRIKKKKTSTNVCIEKTILRKQKHRTQNNVVKTEDCQCLKTKNAQYISEFMSMNGF